MTVQYSIQKMVSDGTLSTIALGIQYLQRNDIYMRIAGEETPQSGAPSGYTWSFLDNTTLKILPVVPNGVEVVVHRRTDIDAMYNVYSQNAQFDEATIDENNQQLLYIAQEYLEQGLPGAGVDTLEYVRDDGSFTYYRMRRTDGSYSEEFPVPSASSSTKVLTRESLRRSYAEAGFSLVAGSFEAGGILTGITDVLLHAASGKAYTGNGPFPQYVAPGTSATSIGYTDRSAALLRDTLQGAVAYLDDYAHLVVAGDWTAALQAALDTGRGLMPNPTYTYTVGGIVQSKGNRILGPLKINPTRAGMSGLGAFTFNGEQGGGFQKNLKLLYVFKVYDLIEFMYIRSMGFNAILHAGALYADRPELDYEPLKVALKLALDNAQTAGLKVNMTTGWAVGDGMAIDYVTTFSPHPAVWGFSVFDEPSFNGVSVTRQNERLAALRSITDKNLNCVDSITNYAGYRNGYNPWARGYDIMFVDAYSHTTPGATLQENIANDLRDMRRDVGVAAVYCQGSKIIPVAGLFISPNFTESVPQLDATASKLVRAAGGDFGVWAWDPLDPAVTSGVKANSDLLALSKSFCDMSISGSRIPKAYRIGGTSFNPENIPPCAAKDGVAIIQKQDGVSKFMQAGTTCLGVLRPGTDAEFAFNGLSGPIGGLLFKGTFPIAITNIEVGQFVTADFELLDVTGSQSGTMVFHYTQDEGATISPSGLALTFDFSTGTPSLSRSLSFTAGSYWSGSKLAVELVVNAPAQALFRICMHGFIVTSEW
jgi:hypothetical protein